MREWLSWWSTTLPRSGSRVRVPSVALDLGLWKNGVSNFRVSLPLFYVYILHTITQHAAVMAAELDAAAAVYGSFIQNGQDQVDFFVFRLRFEYGSDTWYEKIYLDTRTIL